MQGLNTSTFIKWLRKYSCPLNELHCNHKHTAVRRLKDIFHNVSELQKSIFLHLYPESSTPIPQNKFQHAHHRHYWWQYHAVGMPYFIGGRETDESQYDGWSNIQAKHAALDLRSGFRLPSWENSSQVLQWNGLDEWSPKLESQTVLSIS